MAGMKSGAWCHVEIPTAAIENAKRFYGSCFGWKFTDIPQLSYTLYDAGEGEVGGGLWNPAAGVPRQIVNYISVENIESAVARVEANGGKLVNPKMEVPNSGWFVLIADPDGNTIGLWQNMKKPAAAPKKKAAAKKAPAKKKKGKKRK